jgi:isochorismate hydrolase
MAGSSNFKDAINRMVAVITERSASEGDAPGWLKQVAMLTGVLAAISGYLTVRSATLTNDAIYMSDRAILAQTQSSDAWAEYQADSIKARVVETAILTAPNSPNLDALTKEAKELRDRQPGLRKTATEKAAERDAHLKDGGKRLAERDQLVYAGFAAQVGIALASVAALVKMRSIFYLGIGAGVVGVALMIHAFALHLQLTP